LKGNEASFKFYQEEITIELKKVEDDYIFTGFNHMASKILPGQLWKKSIWIYSDHEILKAKGVSQSGYQMIFLILYDAYKKTNIITAG